MSEVTVTTQPQMMSATQMRERINAVQEVMKNIMKIDTHYGTIPGTKKPTLYKAGSEVLLTTFHMGTRIDVTDLSTDDEIRYQVKVIGFHQPTGTVIGEGIGECSTSEDKYKWRSAICLEEFEHFPETRKRTKFSKKYGKIYQTNQVRTEPADLANTVLKMAKKRAQIDLTLTALGASDIFTQDIEDLPEELRQAADDEGNPITPVGSPLEQEAMKKATTVQELAKAMNTLNPEDRKKYMPYYQQRQTELQEATDAS